MQNHIAKSKDYQEIERLKWSFDRGCQKESRSCTSKNRSEKEHEKILLRAIVLLAKGGRLYAGTGWRLFRDGHFPHGRGQFQSDQTPRTTYEVGLWLLNEGLAEKDMAGDLVPTAECLMRCAELENEMDIYRLSKLTPSAAARIGLAPATATVSRRSRLRRDQIVSEKPQ